MSFLRSARTSQDRQDDTVGAGGERVTGVARVVGRLVLWGCVLLLLIRGVASVLAGPPQPTRTPAGAVVTITQPAPAAPSAGRGR